MISNKTPLLRPAGFSLVEIMVGLVIGLLVTLVIMQVFTVFEGQKRTTTGSADAQTNGSVALYTIQRDVQMAGFGLPVFDTRSPPLQCNPSPTVNHDADAATPNIDIFPLTITDGGAAAGASDNISVRYGGTDRGGIPMTIIGGGISVGVGNNLGCQVNDIVLISNGTACGMTTVTALPDPTHITIAADPGVAINTINASLACLGNWDEIVYTVADNALQRDGQVSVADIVNIQAQYGVSDVATSNQIKQWVNASGAWAAPSVVNRNRIKAIRVAVVARNGLLEKINVTNACTTPQGTVNSGPCAWDDTTPVVPAGFVASPAPAIDLSDDPNWQRYRYRVFETIIPLRNMIWPSTL